MAGCSKINICRLEIPAACVEMLWYFRLTEEARKARNSEARSSAHFCSGEAVLHIVCVCSLSYPACKAHAPHCHLWPLAPAYFCSSSYKRYDFRKKLLNITCVFLFSLQVLIEPFLILRRIQGDINARTYSYKYPLFLSAFNETSIFSTYFRKLKHQI